MKKKYVNMTDEEIMSEVFNKIISHPYSDLLKEIKRKIIEGTKSEDKTFNQLNIIKNTNKKDSIRENKIRGQIRKVLFTLRNESIIKLESEEYDEEEKDDWEWSINVNNARQRLIKYDEYLLKKLKEKQEKISEDEKVFVCEDCNKEFEMSDATSLLFTCDICESNIIEETVDEKKRESIQKHIDLLENRLSEFSSN